MSIAIFFYWLALSCQVLAATYAVHLFLCAKSYRLASGLLAAALGLMIGRRISPIVDWYFSGHINVFDAILAALISVLIFLGLIQFKKVLIELEQKNLELNNFTKVDALTGALSRTETFVRAELEIERSLRSGHEVSFLMVDIDHFKNVNDQYGHLVGDAVLVNLVKCCQEQLRAIDIFGRVGGEEFFIVLPESSEGEAYQVAERLRRYVASAITSVDQVKTVSITISLGISTFNPQSVGETESTAILRRFVKMSDDAMYKAKGNGRNRCEIWAD